MISSKIRKKFSIFTAVITLGITGANLALRAQPASGATLTPVNLEDTENWIPHLWQIYLRGGGITTWEATVRPHPRIRTSQPGDPQADLRWPASIGLPWELSIDGKELLFTIGDKQLVGTEIDGKEKVRDDEVFNGLKLWASATTLDNRVSAGTETFVDVTEVNGMAVANDSVSCSATASILGIEQGCQTAYLSDEDIVSLKGVAGFLWDNGLDPHWSNPQSHLQIFIEAFEDKNEPIWGETAQALQASPQVFDLDVAELTLVPEPSSFLSLFTLSGLGLIASLKSRFKSQI